MTDVTPVDPPKYPPPWIVVVLVLTFVTAFQLFFGVGQDIWDAIYRAIDAFGTQISLSFAQIFSVFGRPNLFADVWRILRGELPWLGVVVGVPLAFGVTARLFFFRMDKDDVRRASPATRAKLAAELSDEPSSPEPEPVNYEPWPRFNSR